MDSLYFTKEEKDFFKLVLEQGLLHPNGPFWWVIRLAIARSLRESDFPDDRYKSPGGTISELHLEQITGRRSSKLPDHDDAVRFMLSVRHELDLWEDDRHYVDLMQRHARRAFALGIVASTPLVRKTSRSCSFSRYAR